MKYKYGRYVMTSGWGGQGIYLTSSIVGQHEDGRDTIEESGVVAGTGSGYEDFNFDDEFCKKAVELMNQNER